MRVVLALVLCLSLVFATNCHCPRCERDTCSCTGDPHCHPWKGKPTIELPKIGHRVLVDIPAPNQFLAYMDYDSTGYPGAATVQTVELYWDRCPECYVKRNKLIISAKSENVLFNDQSIPLPAVNSFTELGNEGPKAPSLCTLKRMSAGLVKLDCGFCSLSYNRLGVQANQTDPYLNVYVECENQIIETATEPSICTGQKVPQCYCKGDTECFSFEDAAGDAHRVPLEAPGTLLLDLPKPQSVFAYLDYESKTNKVNKLFLLAEREGQQATPHQIIVTRADDGYLLDNKKMSLPAVGGVFHIEKSPCYVNRSDTEFVTFDCGRCSISYQIDNDKTDNLNVVYVTCEPEAVKTLLRPSICTGTLTPTVSWERIAQWFHHDHPKEY